MLDRNYLSEAVRIKREWPQLGVWGSASTAPEFELSPSEHLERLLPYLALRNTATPKWSDVPSCGEAMPWGAGMCVRTVGRQHLSDRMG